MLAPYFPEIAALPWVSSLPKPPPLPPDAARARVLDAIVAIALDLAAERPLLLALDDVHGADELSLALLARLDPPRVAARGLLVVCLYRDEEAGESLLALAGAGGAERWAIGRLDQEGIAAMAAGMLAARSVPRAWAALLARVSGGNPFFAAEYLRAAVEGGLLTRDAAGRWSLRAADAARGEALPLPTAVEAILDRRLSNLRPEERRLVAAAAVLGRTFDGEIAAATARLGAREALGAASALERRQILEEAGEGRLRFAHDRLRDVAYARLDEGARRALHARAAAAIEARHEGDGAALAVLAHHHAAAGRHDAAYWYATAAAREAEATHADEQAIALYRAALDAAEAGGAAAPRFADAWARLGDLQNRSGRPAEAHEAYALAIARLPPVAGVPGADLHKAQGKTWERRARHDAAHPAYERPERAHGDPPAGGDDEGAWWRAWVQIQIERITAHYWAADMEALGRVVARLEPEVEARGTDAQRALFFQSRVQADLRGARYRTSAATVDGARRCLAGFERGDDRQETARARVTLAAVLLWSDALDEAEDQMLAALDEAEAVRCVPIEVSCLAYLTVIGRRRRDADATRVLGFRCQAAAEAAAIGHYGGVAQANLGWVQLQAGSAEAAGELCRAALERWQGMPLVYPFHWLARLPLLRLAADAGRHEEAEGHVRAMLDAAQQRLPEALSAALSAALGRAASPGGEAAIAEALRVAVEAGFL